MQHNKRLNIARIHEYKEGFVSGRIESIDNTSIYLSDQSGINKFYFRITQNNAVKIGDIIQIKFQQKDKFFFIDEIKILNSVIKNPTTNQRSPYFKLNKNNKKLIEILKNRQLFFEHTRRFFITEDFLEIHSPTLVESPGIESHIEPFETNYYNFNDRRKKYYLPTSPEFSLKEALSSGLEKIFEIAKTFRNKGENSTLHRPDFFMLEWYKAYEDYYSIMGDCEKYIKFIGENLYRRDYIEYKDHKCYITEFKKVKVKDLFLEHNIDLDNYFNNEQQFINDIKNFFYQKNNEIIDNSLNKEDLFFRFFLNFIEPNLGFDFPTIVYEYPFEMAKLSKRCEDNPIYSERFELYICGIEIANAFGELINPVEQQNNFKEVIDFRKKNNSLINLRMPKRFLRALEFGLPPSSGIALGLERLFMLFENLNSLEETNLFDF